MATKLFFRSANTDYSTGNNDTNLRGSAIVWADGRILSTAAGTSTTSSSVTTVVGPTAGVEIATVPICWYSPPLDAAVTISGSITWNIWARESATTVNAAINGRIEKVDGATGAITLINQTARTTELGFAVGNTVQNFAQTPAAGIACKRGDRLRVRIFADDAGTMAAGSVSIGYDGPTAAADGDSWFQLTENLVFVSEPAGTQVFPTATASAVATAATDLEAWTSRGGGVASAVTNTVAGWTVPIQVTDTAGGTVVDWWTRPLTAFTLGGAVRINIRGLVSLVAAQVAVRCEVAVANGDGSSPVVWASGGSSPATNLSTTEGPRNFLIGGTDVAVTNGQRLRIRVYIDDPQSTGPMASGQTATIRYAGAAGATGDTYMTFTQALTEYVPYVPRSPGVNFQNPGVL